MKVAVVLLAAGSGVRFGSDTNKVWLALDDRRVITHSIRNAIGAFKECRTVLVVSEADQELAKKVVAEELPDVNIEIVIGGQTRHGSEFNALKHLSKAIVEGELNVVLIHDGARPLASSDLFARVAKTAFDHGGALPSIDVDPLEMDVVSTAHVARVQTPQGFRAQEVLAAYKKAEVEGFVGTDTAACMEQYFPKLSTIAVDGEPINIKITYQEDLTTARRGLLTRSL